MFRALIFILPALINSLSLVFVAGIKPPLFLI
jgi:hypothetical protein